MEELYTAHQYDIAIKYWFSVFERGFLHLYEFWLDFLIPQENDMWLCGAP